MKGSPSWEIDEATIASWTAPDGGWHVEREVALLRPEKAWTAQAVSGLVAAALARGASIAICDASAVEGSASWSFAVFDGDGALASAKQGVFATALDSSAAEEAVIEMAIDELGFLGKANWICFSDSQSGIDKTGYGLVCGVDKKLAWAPRRFMRPANDRARQALGLRRMPPEPWEGWLGKMVGKF